MAYYKTRNTGTRNTGGTAEHPGIVAEPTEHPGTPTEHQWNTLEQRNLPRRRTVASKR